MSDKVTTKSSGGSRFWGSLRRYWGRYLALFIAVLLVCFFLVTRAALPAIVSSVLSDVLGVPVSIGKVELGLFRQELSIGDIEIGQPEGFGDEPMITAESLELSGFSGLFGGTLQFGEIRLEELKLLLISSPDHELNMSAFVAGIGSSSEDESTSEIEEPENEAGPGNENDEGIVLIERILAMNSEVRHRDESFEDAPFELKLSDIELEIQRLAVGSFPGLEPGMVELKGSIVQRDDVPAPVYLYGRYGAFDDSPISLLARLRITGCAYATLVPVVPENAAVILGGKGIDLDADLGIADDGMDLQGKGVVSNGGRYSFHVYGPFSALEFELPKKLLSVTSRMTGGAGRAVRTAMAGGGHLLKGAVNTAGNLGKGALDAAGKFVGGVGKTAKGALTGDGKEMSEGLKNATVGTGGELVDTVEGGVRDIGESGEKTLDTLSEDPKFRKWLDASSERHAERTGALAAEVDQLAFPPEIELPEPETE